jgi:hypothetical protein
MGRTQSGSTHTRYHDARSLREPWDGIRLSAVEKAQSSSARMHACMHIRPAMIGGHRRRDRLVQPPKSGKSQCVRLQLLFPADHIHLLLVNSVRHTFALQGASGRPYRRSVDRLAPLTLTFFSLLYTRFSPSSR